VSKADAAESTNVERHFLGWDAPALPRAADLLWKDQGPDMGELLVAVPGRRAGRRLEELLLERAEAAGADAWQPPRIEAVGEATDALVRFRRPRASSLLREFTWLQVAQSAGPQQLGALASRLPEADDIGGWMALAELVRGLHGEVAAEGMDFREVAASGAFPEGTREAERWQALANLQDDYRGRLAKAGLDDPHLGRLDALREGRAREDRILVLLGTAGLNPLQKAVVQRAAERGSRVLAMIVAPETEADGFDALGGLRSAAWADASLPIPDDAWTVVERPEDQATAVVQALARLADGRAADEVVVATPAPEVVAPLQRALAAAGAGLRSPVGRELRHSGPWRLLDRLAAFLPGKDPRAFADLLRQPDLERAARDAGIARMERAPAAFDTYCVRHLPRSLDGRWLGKQDASRACADLLDCLREWCGPRVFDDAPSTIAESGDALRLLLEKLYGLRRFDRSDESDRLATATLERLVEALDETARLPEDLGKLSIVPTALLRMLLRRVQATTATPTTARAHDVEQLGWLDLPLDDAPIAVAAGLQHGLVPSDVHAHAFLPDGLRTQLGMSDQAARTARDVYALRVVWETRQAVGGAHFLAGRQGPDGDPWLPSALYFRCAPEQLAARTQAAFPDGESGAAALRIERAKYVPPTAGAWRMPEHFSASALTLYFTSPYAYFLKYVLGLEEPDVPGEELDPLQFGTLLHDVLEDFGKREELHDCADAKELQEALRPELTRHAARRFGKTRHATVQLQLRHAEARLMRFAELQAEQVAQGWRIVHSEWSPSDRDTTEDGRCNDAFAVTIAGEELLLRGRIDRIERNKESGEWRVLDYKSGENARSKVGDIWSAKHERWKDVQLPLYHRIVAQHLPAVRGDIALGYFSLPKSHEASGIWTGAKDGKPFTEELLELAERQVAGAVRDIREAVEARKEAFFRTVGEPRDGMAAVLAGRSYLTSGVDEDEEGDA
jgi:hypothetical protein